MNCLAPGHTSLPSGRHHARRGMSTIMKIENQSDSYRTLNGCFECDPTAEYMLAKITSVKNPLIVYHRLYHTSGQLESSLWIFIHHAQDIQNMHQSISKGSILQCQEWSRSLALVITMVSLNSANSSSS